MSIGSCDGAVREAIDVLGRAEDRRGLPAHQGLSVRQRSRELPEPARDHLRGGAEPRCAAALAADARDRGREVQAEIHPELQRIADVLRSRSSTASAQRSPMRRGCRATGRRADAAGAPHVIHQQAQSRPPLAAHQCAGPDAPPIRGQHVDPVRGLRPRLGHRRDHRGVLGARHACPNSW